jgi:predicted RNA-binding Zn-ribbon protein involved in translation (DUF1610 family)
MDEPDVMLVLSGVSRMCPDCGEQAVFVPADPDDAVAGACCCTSCGAALLIDTEETTPPEAKASRRTA